MKKYEFTIGFVDGESCLHFTFDSYNEMMEFVRTAFWSSSRKEHVSVVINCKEKEARSYE